ncbi:hypothetical protein L226DRAFT_540681 [Lentinus tigrinus ALCF2SS1-7]|uniref:uncharacterized protein n=1 Tax=Lentinus tigrinus ALCF2SS1-7 TaxID=1328758 RepID=UPI00116634B8|nr:hypothetical protein L226DRAFT_540681 [Lentinus tigrinus ALCF2SS1-7]
MRLTSAHTSGQAVCQFFLKGYCSFGNSCRNEHPRSDHSSRESNGRQGPTNTSLNRGVASPVTAPIASADRVPFTCKSLMRDMEAERPMWCLSSYAPDHRLCVIAHLDESPEELRVRATQARKQGTFEEYLKYEAEKLSAATAQFTSALSDIRGFYDIVSKSYRAQSSCASAATQTITWNAGMGNTPVYVRANQRLEACFQTIRLWTVGIRATFGLSPA